jgi:chromosome segregation ATPase
VSTSRLWNIFQLGTGSNIDQQILHHDVQHLIIQAEKIICQQRTYFNRLENIHGELVVRMKEVQVSLELFRTRIIEQRTNLSNIHKYIDHEQQNNISSRVQSMKRIDHLLGNVNDVHRFLLDYRSIVHDVHQLIALISRLQNEIEIHQKSIDVNQIRFDRYRQDLSNIRMYRNTTQHRIEHHRQLFDQHVKQLNILHEQQTRLVDKREQYHRQMIELEHQRVRIIDEQQALLDEILRTKTKKLSQEKQIIDCHRMLTTVRYAYRQDINDYRRHNDRNQHLHRTCASMKL